MEKHKVFYIPDESENVCLSSPPYGAKVINHCNSPDQIVNGDCTNYDGNNGHTSHGLGQSDGILIQLGNYTYLNHFRMLLWDKDNRAQSYRIEVAAENTEGQWNVICDYSKYHCHSWQDIWFHPTVVRYIRVVGNWSSVNTLFHVVSLQAYYDKEGALMHPLHPKWNLIFPKRNVAVDGRLIHGRVVGGHDLLHPESIKHSPLIYTECAFWTEAIVVRLPQPYIISSLRVKVRKGNEYCFIIETSVDGGVWYRVREEKTNDKNNDWDEVEFDPRPVGFIRISATNSSTGKLQISYLECPVQC